MVKVLKIWAAAAGLVAMAGTAQAAQMTLVDGSLGVLDSDTQLEWTADLDLNGAMTWEAANVWITTLNMRNYAGHNDWRLPTLNPSDTSCSDGSGDVRYGYSCTGGELSRLFVTRLGNKAGESVSIQTGDTGEQIANLALFSNVQSRVYWSSTEYAPNPNLVWHFGTYIGVQYTGAAKSEAFYAVAVRPGNMVSAVPETQTSVMLLLGLGAVLALRRRPR